MRFDERTGPVDPKPAAFDLIRTDRSFQAIGGLETWLRHAPQDAIAWQLLANAYRAEQRIDDSYHAFERFLTLKPDDPKAILGLAMTAQESGRPSARLFGHLVANGQADADVILLSVTALTAEGEVRVADQLLQRALQEQPTWRKGHETLASLRWRYGGARIDESFALASKRSSSPDLWIGWARTLVQIRHMDEAIAVVHAARQTCGNRAEFDAIEATIATQAGDHDRAATLFRRAMAIDDVGIRIEYLRHCIRVHALDQAQDLLDPLLNSDSANAVWPYQSVVWRLRGDDRAAWLDGAPIWHRIADIAIPADDLAVIATQLRTEQRQQRHPLDQSPRGGTQTEGNLLDRSDVRIQSLRRSVVDAVRDYATALPHTQGHPFLAFPRSDIRFAGSWSVSLNAGGYHTAHTHPKGWLSGVLYLDTPTSAELGGETHGSLELGQPPADLATGLDPYLHVDPRPGRIVLFPSTMWHATVPFDKGTRLTIAFDVMRPRF